MVLPANLYKPMTLMGVFSKQETNVEFFAKFFPSSKTYETDEVAWDEEEGNSLLITPYSHPLAPAELITEQGFRTFSVKPACIKERRNFDPYHNVVRQPGQDLSKPISKRELALINLKRTLKGQKEAYTRRIEVMAKDILKKGQLDILDRYNYKFNLNFRRHQKLTNFKPAVSWSNPESDMMGDIERAARYLLMISGGQVTAIVVGGKVFQKLRKNKEFKDQLDLRRGVETNLLVSPRKPQVGVQYLGYWGKYPLYEHVGYYTDPAPKEQENPTRLFVGENEVILITNAMDGTRHFGAIDTEVGKVATPYHISYKFDDDPIQRLIRFQSNLILFPKGQTGVNGAMCFDCTDAEPAPEITSDDEGNSSQPTQPQTGDDAGSNSFAPPENKKAEEKKKKK